MKCSCIGNSCLSGLNRKVAHNKMSEGRWASQGLATGCAVSVAHTPFRQSSLILKSHMMTAKPPSTVSCVLGRKKGKALKDSSSLGALLEKESPPREKPGLCQMAICSMESVYSLSFQPL